MGCVLGGVVMLLAGSCGALVCLYRARPPTVAAGSPSGPPPAPPPAPELTSGCRSESFLGDVTYRCDVTIPEVTRTYDLRLGGPSRSDYAKRDLSLDGKKCRPAYGMKVDAQLSVTAGAAKIVLEAPDGRGAISSAEARPGAPARLTGTTRCEQDAGYLAIKPVGGDAGGAQLSAKLNRL